MSEHQSHEETLASKIRELTGENAACCYQCGKCSAGCPMAEEMELKPHDIMRLVHFNQVERVFKSDSMWVCLTCETCTARCPNECDPAGVIDALRELSILLNSGNAPKEIRVFHNEFLKQIEKNGRMFEFGLIAGYKLGSMHLFQDVTAAPGMLTRGKLSFFPSKIKGVKEVRKIFKACEKAGKEHA